MRRVLVPALATLMTISACGTPVAAPRAPIAAVAAQGAEARGLLGLAEKLARHGAEQTLHESDRDRDGRLSKAEAALPDEAFREIDRNGDGWLSLAEMAPDDLVRSYAPVVLNFFRSAFGRADLDKDGRISPDERAQDPLLGDMAVSRSDRGAWDLNAFARTVTDGLLTHPEPMPTTARKPGRTPVLLVHGYLEPSFYFMYGIYRHLQKQGWPVYGINLFPNVSRAEAQIPKVEAKIQQILRETGAKKVNLICHSFGGLISREIIQNRGGWRHVERYVSIASPHKGTAWCYAGPVLGGACIDMRPGSDFLNGINRKPLPAPVRWYNIWTRTDEITLPPAVTNPLPGAKNYPPVPWTEHLLVLWSPITYRYVDQSLK